MAERQSPASAAEQAADWIVRLTCDDEKERARARAGFTAWKAADARHAEAAARIEAFVGRVQDIRHDADGNLRPVHAALSAAHEGTRKARRKLAVKRIGGALVLALAVAMPAWLAFGTSQPLHLLADVRSSEGQWVTRTLDDGTHITLSGTSAINVRYDAHSRTVALLQGEILVDVAKDASRPFYIETPVARIRALGTRFAVSHDQGVSILDMFESRVSVQTAHQKQAGSKENLVVAAGQRVRFSPAGIDRIEKIDPAPIEDGWRKHQLVVNDRPLPEVLDQLMRHRPGRIHYDREQLAHIRVSGVLPLDDPDQALQLLQMNFPQLRMRFVATRWVWVDLQSES